MTKWSYRLIGIGILVALFNIIRLFGGNTIIDIGLMVVIIPIALSFIFVNKKEDVTEDEES